MSDEAQKARYHYPCKSEAKYLKLFATGGLVSNAFCTASVNEQ
jgi:hypothetical protein